MADSKKNTTTKKKNKKTTSTLASGSKGKDSSKKNSAITNAKRSAVSKKSSATARKKNTSRKQTGGKRGKSASQSNKAKIKVRIAQEDVSGIEESMEEDKHSSSAVKAKKTKTMAGDKADGKKSKISIAAQKDTQEGKDNKDKKSGPDFRKREIGGGKGEQDSSESSFNFRPRSISLYKKMALTFILLTLLLVGAVFYFSFVNLTITIVPEQERISDKIIVDVYNSLAETGSINEKNIEGVVEQLEIEETGTYSSNGEEVVGKEIDGRVRIINNYSQNQPLVASTRLLSPNDKLYRIEETVNVPAGGSVEVDIYTEDPSPEKAISSTEFTIPGLWAGLQDRIYAESLGKFTYETKKKIFVKESDIDQSISDLKQKLENKVEKRFAHGYKGYEEIVYDIKNDSATFEIDAEAGDEVEDFQATMEAKVNVVSFDNNRIMRAAEKRLVSRIPDDKQLTDFNKDGMNYSIDNFDRNKGKAAVEVNFDGSMTLADDPHIINRKEILGLNKEQLRDYLNSFEYISDYKIDFTPSFIDKTPTLVDRIDIVVQGQ